VKKLAAISTSISYILLSAKNAFAQGPDIVVNPPAGGYENLGDFITNALQISFIVAIILVLAFLVWGAFDWITSGGDKEAVGKARSKIINALVGMAVLAIAYAIFTLAGQFLGFNVKEFTIPTPPPRTGS